jgi:hypothetical protein
VVSMRPEGLFKHLQAQALEKKPSYLVVEAKQDREGRSQTGQYLARPD